MNVIMPTAMVTMHQDPEQSANSARTSRRGLQLIQALLSIKKNTTTTTSSNGGKIDETNSLIRSHCEAILKVATTKTTTTATSQGDGITNSNDDHDEKLLKVSTTVQHENTIRMFALIR